MSVRLERTDMPKKAVKRTKKRATRKQKKQSQEAYLIVVRSWMLVVVFALMLGIGAIVGTYFQTQLFPSGPTVAGASTYR